MTVRGDVWQKFDLFDRVCRLEERVLDLERARLSQTGVSIGLMEWYDSSRAKPSFDYRVFEYRYDEAGRRILEEVL